MSGSPDQMFRRTRLRMLNLASLTSDDNPDGKALGVDAFVNQMQFLLREDFRSSVSALPT
jgi:hypothetical protein